MKVMVPFLRNYQEPSKGKVAHRNFSNVVFQIFLLGLLMALLFSCKVYRNIDNINPPLPKDERSKTFEPRQLERIQSGDKLYLVMKNETSYDIVYSVVENDSIKGLFLQKNNKRIKSPIETGVPLDKIQSLKIEKTSAAATIGMSLGVLGVTIFLALKSLESMFSGITFGI